MFYDTVTEVDIDNLYDLWSEGKEGNNPEPVTIAGETWEYFDEDYPNRSVGDTWIADGYKYLYLGSGIRTKLSAPIPEPATLILLTGSLLAILRKNGIV